MGQRLLLFGYLVWGIGCGAFAQQAGIPLIQNFLANDYGGDSQNWCIAQSNNGFLYVGNNAGVLEFDGQRWRRYPTTNKSVVKSVAVSPQGEVFVGAKGELGLLRPDSTHTLRYVSLLPLLPDSLRNFGDVWQIFTDRERAYFRLNEAVLIYQDGQFTVFRPPGKTRRFHMAFMVEGVFYVRDTDLGLLRFHPETNQLQPLVPEGIFGFNAAYGLFLDAQGRLLALLNREGLLRLDTRTQAIDTLAFVAQKQMYDSRAYYALPLPEGRIAVATLTNGLFILDESGNIQQHFHKNNGLPSSVIYGLALDRDQNLWLATDKGISCVYLSLPYFTIYEAQGIEGRGLTVDYLPEQNKLYLGTTFGIYQADYPGKEGQIPTFTRLDETKGYALSSSQLRDTIYYGHNLGIFAVQQSRAEKLKTPQQIVAWNVLPLPPQQPDGMNFLVARSRELSRIQRQANSEQWSEKSYPAYPYLAYNLTAWKGYLWTRHRDKGLFRLRFDDAYDSLLEVKNYSVSEGLPDSLDNNICVFGDRLLATTNAGVYAYSPEQDRFLPDSLLQSLLGTAKVFDLYQDPEGKLWYRVEGEKGVIARQGESYAKQTDIVHPLHTIKSFNTTKMLSNGQMVWGVEEGFLVLDTKRKFPDLRPPMPHIRRVEWMTTEDSLLFGGVDAPGRAKLVLPPDRNALRFSFAAPEMRFSQQTRYRYRLQGLEKDWSSWDDKTQKEYTNLSAGDYTFEVQAQNIAGLEGQTARFSFQILPPWYATPWAYVMYALLAGLGVWAVIKINIKRLERDKNQLEALVQARTSEIQQQKEELQSQANQLAQANAEITHQKEELQVQAESLLRANASVQAQKQALEQSYRNVRILSYIGQEITNILDSTRLIQTVYQHVNTLMPADGFGIGIHEPDNDRLRFVGYIENGEELPEHFDLLDQTDKLSVRCWLDNQKIILHDLPQEHQASVTVGFLPKSLVYLPLCMEGKPIGVMTVQSMHQHSYTELQLDMLDTLAAYTAIALDNIRAYRLIANKNTHITDSIRYAQTIQQAILPPDEELRQYCQEYFVLFRPKDIVSGDFYWAAQTESRNFFAVADCTGHGVPGAFMSMLGHAFLTEAINQQQLATPDQILEWLHTEIALALRQEQEANTDGMDIALCIIDNQATEEGRRRVHYCGAKRPLFYALPTGEIASVRGTRRSIGGKVRRSQQYPFQTTTLELPAGTALYLFSDGFSDQSNAEGGKIGTQTLKRWLQDLHTMPMHAQAQQLEQALDQHQGMTAQRDDITLLGLRIG